MRFISDWNGETFHSETLKLIKLIWKKELPHQWKESIVVPIHKKGDKTDCSNYRGISLLPTLYKIVSSIVLSRIIPYADEIIVDHRCEFRRNRSATDHIFYISQTLEKKWDYNGTVHHLFRNFKKAGDSVRREVICNTLIEFGIPRKLVWLIKMCLNKTYSSVRIGKNLCDMLPRVFRSLKQGGTKQFSFVLEYGQSKKTRKDWNWIGHTTFGLCWWC
jgi:hypothetical protein